MYFIIFGKLSTYVISCSLTFSGTPLTHILVQLMASYISGICRHAFFLFVLNSGERI